MLVTPLGNHEVFDANVLKHILRVLFILSGVFSPLVIADNNEPNVELPKRVTISFINHKAVNNLYKPIIQQAYKSLGIQVSFTSISVARTQDLMARNLLDGDVARGNAFVNDNPNVMPVGPALGRVSVFIICQSVLTCEVDAMQGYSVGVLGSLEQYRGVINEQTMDIVRADEQEHLVKLFNLGRLDYFISSIVLSAQFNDDISRPHNRTLLHEFDIHHIINKRLDFIAPQLAQAIEHALQQQQQ